MQRVYICTFIPAFLYGLRFAQGDSMWIIEILLKIIITAVIILGASKIMSSVQIKNTTAALWTSFWIVLVGLLVGWLFTFLLNVLTLGLFALLGLKIIIWIIVYSIVIELVDQFRSDFKTKGFLPSLILAVLLAIGWGLISYLI